MATRTRGASRDRKGRSGTPDPRGSHVSRGPASPASPVHEFSRESENQSVASDPALDGRRRRVSRSREPQTAATRKDLGLAWWEKKQLEADVQAILNDKEEMALKLSGIDADVRGLEDKLKRELPGFSDLKQQLQAAEEIRTQKISFLESTSRQMQEMRQTMVRVTRETMEAEREIETMRNEMITLRKDYASTMQKFKVVSGSMTSLKKEKALLSKQLTAVEKRKLETELRQTKQEKENAELLSQVDSTMEDLGTLQEHEKELRAEAKNLQGLLCQALREVKDSKSKETAMEKDIGDLKTTSERVYTDILGNRRDESSGKNANEAGGDYGGVSPIMSPTARGQSRGQRTRGRNNT